MMSTFECFSHTDAALDPDYIGLLFECVDYTEYNGDLFRYHICNYLYEVGTKFDDCGTNFVEHSTKYTPKLIKYRP